MPHVPLVDIAICLIRSWFAMATVRGTAMVVDAGVLGYHGWKNTFVDISGREIGVSEVAHLIRIVKFEIQRLGQGVI